MSVTQPVEAQFAAYNAHDLDAFVACFAPDFRGYRMPTETPSTVGREALRAFYGSHRFNNPTLKAELITRTLLGNKAGTHRERGGVRGGGRPYQDRLVLFPLLSAHSRRERADILCLPETGRDLVCLLPPPCQINGRRGWDDGQRTR